MTKALMMRLLSATILAVPMAFLFLGHQKSKLVDWISDPQTAQLAYVNLLRHNSIGTAFSAMLLIFLGVTLVVEILSFVLSRSWRRASP